MRRLLPLMMGVAAIAAATAGRTQAASPGVDLAPRVEAAEVKRMADKGEAVLVDVRGRDAWNTGHAQGALHVPEAQILSRLADLPKDKLIALYCT